MNPDAEKTAGQVLNLYDEMELKRIFRQYGEIKNAGSLSASITRKRQSGIIETSADLQEAIGDCLPSRNRQQYLARVYQALRIEVNDELNSLKEMLEGVTGFIKEGGRLVLITYHSLEDRIVKNYFRSGTFSGEVEKDIYGNRLSPFRQVNRKVIIPGEKEVRENPRARSAKLRIGEKQTNHAA